MKLGKTFWPATVVSRLFVGAAAVPRVLASPAVGADEVASKS